MIPTGEDLSPVKNVFERRRLRLDATIQEMAEDAGINRDTVTAIEAGKGSPGTRSKYAAALSRMEEDLGLPPIEGHRFPQASEPEEPRGHAEAEHGGVVRVIFEGVYGAKSATVEAPADNPDALAAAIDILMRGRDAGQQDDSGSADTES